MAAAMVLVLPACASVITPPEPAPVIPPSPFVQVCGESLCLHGQPWRIHGATVYGSYGDPDTEIALAKRTGLNTLEIVEFEHDYHSLASTMSETTWQPVDALIAGAAANGLHVVLNLSGYGQSLMAAGQKPTTTDWDAYLRFVVGRVNTKNGVRYGDDPTIAKIELYGEIDAPNYAVPLRGTTAETTAFFARTLHELKALDPNHVVSSGGFSYINDPGSGIDWRTIVADPDNATCDIEVNSFPDRDISVPAMNSASRGSCRPGARASTASGRATTSTTGSPTPRWRRTRRTCTKWRATCTRPRRHRSFPRSEPTSGTSAIGPRASGVAILGRSSPTRSRSWSSTLPERRGYAACERARNVRSSTRSAASQSRSSMDVSARSSSSRRAS
jgi:hypothetical protein